MSLQIFRYSFFLAFLMFFGCTKEVATSEKHNVNTVSNSAMNSDVLTGRFYQNGYNNIYLGQAYNAKQFSVLSEELDGCFTALSLEHDNIFITVENGIISQISTDSPNISSYDNIKVGDPLSIIKNKINTSHLEVIQNGHTNLPVYIHWHDKDKTIGTRYSTDDGVSVHYIDIGFNERMYLHEGCA